MPTPGSRHTRIALSAILVLVVLGLGANAVRRALKGSSAFDDTMEYAQELVFQRINVYETHATQGTHSKYPPFFFLFTAPLAVLPLGLAAAIWFLLNAVLAAACVVLAVRAFRRPDGAEPPPLLAYALPALLAAVLIVTNLQRGQVNILILFFVCLGIYAFRRGWDLRAGLALGVAVALKLTPALLVAYLLYKRAWKVAIGAGVALVLAWAVLPALVFGPDEAVEVTRSWSRVIASFSEQGVLGEGIEGVRHTNQSLSAAFYRFFTATPAGAGRTDFYVNVASIGHAHAAVTVRVLSIALLLGLAWLVRGPPAPRGDITWGMEISLVLLVILFVSPISWINHYVALIVPYAAALEGMGRSAPQGGESRRLGRATVICAVLTSSSVVLLCLAFSLPLLGAMLLAGALAVARTHRRRRSA